MQALMPGLSFQIVPRVEETLIGIQATRLAMSSGKVFIDADECLDGIVALDNYRKTYNARLDAFTDVPMHDRYSNFADAFRQWGQGFDSSLIGAKKRPTRRAKGGMGV
jgi:hypothetical protein